MAEEPLLASLQSVVVEKQKLIDQLQANRATHRAEFEKALAGYKARCIELLEQHIDRIKKGKVERVNVVLPMPEDHTEDYDSAIENLDWSLYDQVELTAREFDTLVRDKWNWKDQFTTTNALYNSPRR